jgi:transposase
MQVIGVDCHKAEHVAVVIDVQGQERGHWRGANTPDGWQELAVWAAGLAPDAIWGIEGSGQYGRGLAQALVTAGIAVREVNPRLSAAMRRGSRSRSKSDRLDALAIARVVQQEGATLPAVQEDDATAVLAVQVAARDGLIAEITALRNQLHQHLVQLAPVQNAPWPPLTVRREVAMLVDYSVPGSDARLAAHATQVRLLASRMVLAMDQADILKREIAATSGDWTAPLQAIVGVGPLTAGMLAAHLGGKTFADDAALAMYAGVAPLEASSGSRVRHRLNRTGNRQLNAVLHRIALCQSRISVQGRTYLAKKQVEGKTRKEAFRCLKRLLARIVLTAWRQCQIPALTTIVPPPLT